VEATGQLQAPLKEPRAPTEQEYEWSTGPVRMFRRREKSIVRWGNRNLDHPAHGLLITLSAISD
jgi:hypothetical protein